MKNFDYLNGRMPEFTVIPTCADLTRFVPSEQLRQSEFVLGYVGSAGTWYLFDEAISCFVQLLRMYPTARILIVNRGEHAFIRERLDAACVPDYAVELTAANHEEMPRLIARMHAAVFFIKPLFSKQASAPTKLAEFLGCGIPCLGNTGVGDMAAVLLDEQVGVVIDTFDDLALSDGLRRLIELASDPKTSERCVAAARKHFSLEQGVCRYARIYRIAGSQF